MLIPMAWQSHGVLPEHLSALKDLLRKQRGGGMKNEELLEELAPQLKDLGQAYNNATHAEFTGFTDEEGDTFFLDVQKGRVVLGIGWGCTNFAAESCGVFLRKVGPDYLDLFIGKLYYR